MSPFFSADRKLRVRAGVTAKLLDNGQAVVVTPEGRAVAVRGDALPFILAFGTGQSEQHAATASGRALSVDGMKFVDALVAQGILVPVSLSTETHNRFAKRIFDEHAVAWSAATYRSGRSRSHFAHARIALVLELLARRSGCATLRILDLGCGSGAFLARAAEAGHHVHGVDASPTMIALADTRADSLQTNVRRRITTEVADIVGYESPASYDVVVALGVLCWFDDVTSVLGVCRRSVSEDGIVLVDCANALATPEGAMWLFNEELLADLSMLLSRTLAFGDVSLSSAAEQAIATLDHRAPSDEQDTEPSSKPHLELRIAPTAFVRAASAAGLELSGLCGIGDLRSIWNHLLSDNVAFLMNARLRAFSTYPISVLWSTGFLAALEPA